jgi:hypothetical protein
VRFTIDALATAFISIKGIQEADSRRGGLVAPQRERALESRSGVQAIMESVDDRNELLALSLE